MAVIEIIKARLEEYYHAIGYTMQTVSLTYNLLGKNKRIDEFFINKGWKIKKVLTKIVKRIKFG